VDSHQAKGTLDQAAPTKNLPEIQPDQPDQPVKPVRPVKPVHPLNPAQPVQPQVLPIAKEVPKTQETTTVTKKDNNQNVPLFSRSAI
jgi:hypothetical protein